jgi:predicted NAD/FAD-dependent oxidoreductase
MVRSYTPDDGPLGWTARNSSKPRRDGPETWVLHARPEWSRTYLERSPDAVARVLTMAFREQTGAPEPFFADAHRWRYARVRDPLGTAFQYDQALGLATCGDWHLGARVEAAWTSGHLLANKLLR